MRICLDQCFREIDSEPCRLNQFLFYHFIVGSSSHWLLVILLPVLEVPSRIRCELDDHNKRRSLCSSIENFSFSNRGFWGGFRRVLCEYKKLHQTPVGYQGGSLGSWLQSSSRTNNWFWYINHGSWEIWKIQITTHKTVVHWFFHENRRVLEVYETNQKEQFFGFAFSFPTKTQNSLFCDSEILKKTILDGY